MRDEEKRKNNSQHLPSPVGGEIDMTVMTDLGLPVL